MKGDEDETRDRESKSTRTAIVANAGGVGGGKVRYQEWQQQSR